MDPAVQSWHGFEGLPSDFVEQYRQLSWAQQGQLPVVYHPKYNITFLGLEKLHPFDSSKFKKVVASLIKAGAINEAQLVQAFRVHKEMLRDVHSDKYLQELETSSLKVAQVTELLPLAVMPNFIVQQRVVQPMQYHVGGTIVAAGLAAKFGWAINLGGGMHHASRDDGMGWCPYDDIYLAIRFLRTASRAKVKKILYVDVDAHQGNGVGRDKLHFNDQDLFVLDVYNKAAFPRDVPAKAAINVRVELQPYTQDAEYLQRLQRALDEAAHHQQQQQPGGFSVMFYNAGTDPLDGDPLGALSVSAQGIITRDEMVWRWAQEHKIPICMTLSGGYSRESAGVISQSILNLFDKFQLGATSCI